MIRLLRQSALWLLLAALAGGSGFMAVLVGLALPASAVAAEESKRSEELAIQVRKLVRGLDSDELARRDEAEAALVKLGPEILDLLPEINDRMPAETKHRLQRVRQQLLQALAEEAGRASLVTLEGDAMTLVQWIEAVRQQTGNTLVDYRKKFGQEEQPIEVKIDAQKAPFWPTLDTMLDEAGMTVYPYGDEPALALVARPPGEAARSGHAAYAGPFRIEALEVEAVRDLRVPDNSTLKLQLEVAWEPRLAPIALSQRLDAIEATDENARALQLPGEDVELEVPVQFGTMASRLEIPMSLPSRDVHKIGRLKGKLHALVPGKMETFRFEQLAKEGKPGKQTAEVQRKGSAMVALDAARKNNELWEVRLRVRYDKASGALESHRGWIYRNPCYLVDAQGKKYPYDALESTLLSEDEVGIAFLFDVPGLEGLTLVYETPGAILSLPVEYTLQNIELP